MNSPRVDIRPELLSWAIERASMDPAKLAESFKWLRAAHPQPTLVQLEKFANKVHVPYGYLFASEPPEEPLPIADLRTKRDDMRPRPSPELLEVIYANQARQDWYRELLLDEGAEPLSYIASLSIELPPVKAAAAMRAQLSLQPRKASEAFSELRRAAESIGVLVMVTSGLSSTRKLDVGEFRGFALADPLAPLVFINGADAKAAQLFTLAHELAHLWLGASGLSSLSTRAPEHQRVERWCNEVAAEFLVPARVLADKLPKGDVKLGQVRALAERFSVSSVVMLRRLYSLKVIPDVQFWSYYRAEEERWNKKSGGGDYYKTKMSWISPAFGKAVAAAAWEGSESIRDAMELLDVTKVETFKRLSRRYGVFGVPAQ